MTIFFRNLGDINKETVLDSHFIDPLIEAFYATEELKGDILDKWKIWFSDYKKQIKKGKSIQLA